MVEAGIHLARQARPWLLLDRERRLRIPGCSPAGRVGPKRAAGSRSEELTPRTVGVSSIHGLTFLESMRGQSTSRIKNGLRSAEPPYVGSDVSDFAIRHHAA